VRSAIQISPKRKETCGVRYELLLAKLNRTKEKKLPHLTACLSVAGGYPHTETTGVVPARVVDHQHVCLKLAQLLRTDLSELCTGRFGTPETRRPQYARVA